jgi:GxxExxY protein
MKQVWVSEEIEALATQTVSAAFAVHKALGPGLLESAYQECLQIELALAGLHVEREKPLPLVYRGHVIDNAYRLDLIINGKLLIELKAIDGVQPIHRVQVTTYLKLLHFPLGLLINFNVPLIKDGITRVLNLNFQSNIESPTREQAAHETLAPSRLRA